MPKLELKIDAREVWSAYADRLYAGDKLVKSATEMLQNSVDSRSREVRIGLVREATVDKDWVLTFADDGCGMTTDVFLNRFLCLGAKTNEEGDRTGGNGVAKAIILFNRQVKDFSITSVAEGRKFKVTQAEILGGAELKDEPTTEKPGVTFVIRYHPNSYIYPDHLSEMLSYARLSKTSIFLNGEKIGFDLEPSPLHSEIVGHPVYKARKPQEYRGHIVVLSNGLPQFDEWTGGTDGYVVNFERTTYKDFTPARERLANPGLEDAFRRLRERMRYEQENPLSSKIPPQPVKKRFTYNLKQRKIKRSAPVAPKPREVEENLAESFLEDDRRAALVTSGIQSVVESAEERMNRLLESLVPCRGVIIEDRSTNPRREWHPEKSARFRKILALMDRSIEILEEAFPDLEVANIGLMRDSKSHDAHWSDDDKGVLIDVAKLDRKFSVAAHQVLYTLTHELAHRWERSHNERFSTKQAELLNAVARRAKDFGRVRKEIRRIR